MKKIFASLALIGLVYTANSQKIKLGVKAGANFANWNIKALGEKETTEMIAGLHAGVVADFNIGKSLSLQPQLLFSSKGFSEKHNDHSDKIVVTALDLPINLLYKTPIGIGKFFVGGGPNIGLNLSAKDKAHNETIKIGNSADAIKALDLGVNVTTGVELKNKLFFGVNYNYGLSNLSNVNNLTQRSNVLGVSVGYFF